MGRIKHASFYVKAAFVVLASAVVSALQFLQIAPGQTMTAVQAGGLTGSIVLFFGGVFVLITEEDATEELSVARQALEAARSAEAAVQSYEERDETLKRVTHLYLAAGEMRRVLEKAATSHLSLKATLGLMLESTSRLLPVAASFAQSDRWTICVYKGFPDPAGGRDSLVCVDHLRAISCSVARARRWAEGVGVAGISYATRGDIIVPNLHTFGLGTLFNVAGQSRDYDADRYRSTAAFPIMVDGREKPWGVVVATNDRYDHFNLDQEPGLQTSEAVRLVASMTALAVAICTDNVNEPTQEGDEDPASGGSIQTELIGGGENG
jgi:hypothetical protein